MHGRKKSDLPQTKEEKDAVQAKISNYKKASRTFATNVCPPSHPIRAAEAGPSNRSRAVTAPGSRSAPLACLIGGLSLGSLLLGSNVISPQFHHRTPTAVVGIGCEKARPPNPSAPSHVFRSRPFDPYVAPKLPKHVAVYPVPLPCRFTFFFVSLLLIVCCGLKDECAVYKRVLR